VFKYGSFLLENASALVGHLGIAWTPAPLDLL
jgi:hypothetical protein